MWVTLKSDAARSHLQNQLFGFCVPEVAEPRRQMGEMVDRWRGAGQRARRPDLGGIGIDAPVSPKPGIGVSLVGLELRRRALLPPGR